MIWLMVNQNQTKFWQIKHFKIASYSKYNAYQKPLAAMVYKFFDKNSSGSGIGNEPIIDLQMKFISRLFENL